MKNFDCFVTYLTGSWKMLWRIVETELDIFKCLTLEDQIWKSWLSLTLTFTFKCLNGAHKIYKNRDFFCMVLVISILSAVEIL